MTNKKLKNQKKWSAFSVMKPYNFVYGKTSHYRINKRTRYFKKKHYYFYAKNKPLQNSTYVVIVFLF